MFIPAYVLPIGLIALSTGIFGIACMLDPRGVMKATRSGPLEISRGDEKDVRITGVILFVLAVFAALVVH